MGSLPRGTPGEKLSTLSYDGIVFFKALIFIVLILISISMFGRWGIVALGVVFFLKLPMHVKISMLAISSFFSIGPGTALGSFEITFFYLVVPFLLLTYSVGRIPIGFRKFRRVALLSGLGVVFLLAGLFISYVRNPVLARSIAGGIGGAYGLKSYFVGLMCITTYFISYSSVRNGLVRGELLVKVLLFTSLIIGALRLLSYFGILEVPFFRGSLMYLGYEEDIAEFTSRARRIGGMDITAGVAIAASFTFWDLKKFRILTLTGFCGGGMLLILGGGRSAFIGVSLMLLISFMRRGTKAMIRIAIPLILVYIIMNSITFGGERSVLESQQQRLFMYEAVIERQAHRVEGYQVLLQAWSDNPVFGKGISPVGESGETSIEGTGGHGSYFSLVGLFGLFGLAFIFLTMAFPLYRGVKQVMRTRPMNAPESDFILTRFLSLLIVFFAVYLGAAGNGYATPSIFLVTGLLVALLEKEEKRQLATVHRNE
jgi:hypothetical protein